MARCGGMAYELRADGQPPERFDTQSEAESRARTLIRADADRVVEIIDLTTNRPCSPAAGAEDKENLARKIGF